MLLDQFSRGLHLSPDILDVLIESHILTQLELHNYTRIPTKTRTCSLQRGGDKKSFSLLFPFFLSHIEKRKSKTMLFCLFVCLCFTYWSASAQTPFAFFFVFSDFPHQGWHWVACWIWFKRRKKKKKKKRERKFKKRSYFHS